MINYAVCCRKIPKNIMSIYITLFDALLLIPASLFHTKIVVESIISISILISIFSFAVSLIICFLFQLLSFEKRWKHKLDEWSERMHQIIYICEVTCLGVLFVPLFVLLSEMSLPSANINSYTTRHSLIAFICAFILFIHSK